MTYAKIPYEDKNTIPPAFEKLKYRNIVGGQEN
jgi:hypothetical protein